MTVAAALGRAADELASAGVDSPRVDAEWLLAHALGRSRTDLYAEPEHSLSVTEAERLRELVARRCRREPLAYVLGEWGFRRLTLRVDRRVLVPRPETEALVERCLQLIAPLECARVLDVGVGTGAIALSIAAEHPGALVVATDSSRDALALARENQARLGLNGRVELVHGVLLAGLAGPFDLVVSNPPYVAPEDYEALQPEIRLYEPRAALVGTRVGEAVAREARGVLEPSGAVVLEVGDGQARETAAALAALGYREVTISRDLAERERVVEGRWHG